MSRGRGGAGKHRPQNTSLAVDWGGWFDNYYTGTTSDDVKGSGTEDRSSFTQRRQTPWAKYVINDELFTKLGKKPSVIQWSSNWKDSGTYTSFLGATSDKATTEGLKVVRGWVPNGIGDPALDSINAGTHDSYITTFATDAKNWGKPFILRMMWEMNASWFVWGASRSGNTAAKYVSAWQRIHGIFQTVGVPNCQFAWVCNDERSGTAAHGVALEDCYPGDAYVDWIGVDGYNFGATNPNGLWNSFDTVFGSTYDRLLTLAPTKRMMIGEIGCVQDSSNKAQWHTDMFAALSSRFTKIEMLLLFDQREIRSGSPFYWWFDSVGDTNAKNAFASGIGGARFNTNGAAF